MPDDISSPDELILSALPDDVDPEFEIFSDPDDMMVPEKLTLFHELVASIIHEEVDHVVHKVFHELVVLPDDVDPENAISPSHSDQVDVSHEAELHDSLMVTVVQVVDPVDSTTAEQSWSEGVYKIGTHLVVFVYCFSSIAIQVLDRIVRASFVLLSGILDSRYQIVRLVGDASIPVRGGVLSAASGIEIPSRLISGQVILRMIKYSSSFSFITFAAISVITMFHEAILSLPIVVHAHKNIPVITRNTIIIGENLRMNIVCDTAEKTENYLRTILVISFGLRSPPRRGL
ncbi:MAG: hypothetical protein U0518_02870 [Candidatus Gracilibacteria bacterium]